MPSIYAVITFERWYGGTESDAGNSVVQTFDGGYIAAGSSESFGPGGADVYLIRVDSLGDTLWTKTYGGPTYDISRSIAATSDGGFIVVGYTLSFGAGTYDVYLIKTDSIGDTIWTKTYGGAIWDFGYSVAQTSDGGYIVSGETWSFGSGTADVYLIKTNSLGQIIWIRTYGDSLRDDGRSVAQTSDDGYIITGRTHSYGAGLYDIYLVKTDSLGDTLWTKTYGGNNNDFGYSVSQTADGGYILLGSSESFGVGAADFYLIKTNANGDTIWTRTYGGNDYEYGYSVAVTTNGGYILLGSTSSFGAGSSDIWFIKTNSIGDTLWTRTYGGIGSDGGSSVQQTSDEGYIITGMTKSYGSGNADIYLIKTDSLGNVGVEEQTDKRPRNREKRLACHPNPFIESVEIQLHGVTEYGCIGESEIQIFDVTGRKVREISLLPFNFSLEGTWNGRDKAGKVVAPGIYFLKFQGKSVGKIVKVR